MLVLLIVALLCFGWWLGGRYSRCQWPMRLGRPDYSHNTAWWRKAWLRHEYHRAIRKGRGPWTS